MTWPARARPSCTWRATAPGAGGSHAHRRVAFCDTSEPVMTTRRRLKGYREAVAEAGLDDRPDLVCTSGGSPEESAAKLVGRLTEPDAPTAVFSSNVPCTIALVLALP